MTIKIVKRGWLSRLSVALRKIYRHNKMELRSASNVIKERCLLEVVKYCSLFQVKIQVFSFINIDKTKAFALPVLSLQFLE